MKPYTYLLIAMILTLCIDADAIPRAKITVIVKDEDGTLLSDAEVNVSFALPKKLGAEWGSGLFKTVKQLTDSHGKCVISGDTAASLGLSVGKAGYYGSAGQTIEFTDVVLGHWQPWNQTIEVVLKKIVNPIPMYARKVEVRSKTKIQSVIKSGEVVAYDLEKGDWIIPYGRGETADFIFQIKAKPERAEKNQFGENVKLFDATLVLSFSNAGDGIQHVLNETRRDSVLRLPRIAPDAGYKANHTSRTYHLTLNEPTQSENKNLLDYFFRVRTKMDEQGNISSALYGKIYGEIGWDIVGRIKITYYLNPTPNDRNMEFDPTKNLFKKLTSLEEVHDP
jgi:hypothetical protein